MKFKLLRNFKKLALGNYLVFATNVRDKMLNNPAYAAEQGQVNLIVSALGPYEVAASAAVGGGTALKQVRKEKKVILDNELDTMAGQLELVEDQEESWFTSTGFEVRRKPSDNTQALPKAVIIELRRGILSGSLEGMVDRFPPSVRQIALRWSSDNGTTWHNGTYSTGRRFLLEDLPVQQYILVQACFQGTRQRLGDWSDSRGEFVL